MKIATISDIHGNLPALINAYDNIKKEGIDTIICLGDLVGYGPFPNEVIEFIKDKNILTIKGNYDASVVDNKFSYIRDTEINKFSLPWAVNELSAEHRNYLLHLPKEINLKFNDKSITFVHGSPRKINEYLHLDSKEAEEVMKDFSGDLLVCAHTHLPYIKKYQNKILFNQGSIGKPKFGKPNSSYGVIEILNDQAEILIEIKEISYDFHKTIEVMKAKNFPEKIITSIETGIEK
ncbi:phosphoesterase, MJ0936 family [Desulfonispora thiosulfatigenes DSM 11270]|uniref:Phosphoesterase n=1 Tax=Desulfonispora thiosulfatigenes DSM 11270 TaxID=656914 RepID=A0A1W1VTA8_DESTI|nr:YfcE family phosphodiesterase [Desulfonispora thiosulfatigenes]SMB96589.1 phosphoesterase, MJ0936 family [Desulfonispora thiosulfatigenes DSM 11270]